MLKRTVILLLLVLAFNAYSQGKKGFVMLKGDIGYGFYPFIVGYCAYSDIPDPFKYAGGLSFNGDIKFRVNNYVWAGLNVAAIPILKLDDVSFKFDILFIPISAEIHLDQGTGFYMDAGAGINFLNGSGSTDSFGVSFLDAETGENYGDSVSKTVGPFFNLNLGVGYKIAFMMNNQLGLDLFFKNYLLLGHKGLDELHRTSAIITKIPEILMKVIMNCGIGLYYNF